MGIPNIMKTFMKAGKRQCKRGPKHDITCRPARTSVGVSARSKNQRELHKVCERRASLNTIQQILERDPCMARQRNAAGQTPLHVVVQSGSTPEVVNCLLEHYPEAASIQNREGKAPLHYACSISPHLVVVKALCNASPQTVNLEDKFGVSALEYAIINDAPACVIKLLHRTSERQWFAASKRKVLIKSSRVTPAVAKVNQRKKEAPMLPQHR